MISGSNSVRAHRPRWHRHGMTLIELVVALALLALLLGLAVPEYRHYVRRGYRVAAIERLLDAARCQERVYASAYRYDTTRCLPDDPTGRYRFRFDPADTVGTLIYTVRAEPLASQRQDPCGSLALDQTGRRSVGVDGMKMRECWAGR